jgi:hypothetical protein
MNPTIITKARPPRLQKPWTISGGLAFLLIASANAQSAASFNTSSEAAPAPQAIKAPVLTKAEPGPVSNVPSRYVGGADLEAYVASLTAIFSMRQRDTDPFGQLQDPNAKPLIKTPVAKTSRRVVPILATPFADIIRLIKVTTIMPGERRFLVGTRSIKEGDRIPLVFRGKTISVEVISVRSHQIDMRNLDNGETASLKMSLLPVGMTPGTRGISAPGMVPDRPNAPIDLDGGNPLDAQSQNR